MAEKTTTNDDDDARKERLMAVEMMRFFHDYRQKALQFNLGLNGALIAFAVKAELNVGYRTLIVLLGIGVTLCFLLLERRSIDLANWWRAEAVRVEQGMTVMTWSNFVQNAENTMVKQRTTVAVLYGLMLLTWCGYLLISSHVAVVAVTLH
ncbi:MAG: hypothetical protein HY985_17165 [Magnetospirillum sp.]|nr:hypothetical protein [Magnetospirillum sp.]